MPVITPAGPILEAFAAWQAAPGSQGPALQQPQQPETAPQPSSMARLLQRNAHRAAPWGMVPSQQQILPAPAAAHGRAAGGAVVLHADQGALRRQPCHTASAASRGYPPDMRRAAAAAAGSVVAAVAESGDWATAVLASAPRGYLVTNAHLVAPRAPAQEATAPSLEGDGEEGALGSRLRVQLWHRGGARGGGSMRWHAARAIFAFRGPLDLAVLQLEDSGALAAAQPLRLSAGPDLAPGQPVAVLGFPLFAPRSGLGPCASAGVVTKVRMRHARACICNGKYCPHAGTKLGPACAGGVR